MATQQLTRPPISAAPNLDQEWPPQAVELMRAMAHPKRLAIVSLLRAAGELTVSQIYIRLELPQAIASQHLITLKDRGVLTSRKAETAIYYSLAPLPDTTARTLAHISQLLADLAHEAPPTRPMPPAATGQAGAVILELYAKGTRLFGSVEGFNRWLSKPNYGVGFAVPYHLLLTPEGPALVLDELVRLEHGDLA